MTWLLACSTHTAIAGSLMFCVPMLGVVGWIKFDSWRRRGEPEQELEHDRAREGERDGVVAGV